MDIIVLGLTTIVALILLPLAYSLYRCHRSFQLFRDLGIPGPRPRFWCGNLSDFVFESLQPIHKLQEWRQRHGKVFGYYLGTDPVLVVGDVDLLKRVAIQDFGHFVDRYRPPSVLRDHYPSLLTLKGQRWKEVRSILTPAFTTNKLRNLVPIVATAVSDFDASLRRICNIQGGSGELDIYDRFKRLSVDVIGESVLAMKINSQNEEQSKVYHQIQAIMATTNQPDNSRMARLMTYFPVLFNKLFQAQLLRRHPVTRNIQELFEHLKRVLNVRRQFPSSPASSATVDMLQLMLDASEEAADAGRTSLTDHDIVGNCFVFLVAGFDTTAATLAYVTYMLATHPDVQDRVHQEILSNVKDVANMTYVETNQLPYLDQVIKETLRKFPPFWIFHRVCSRDYELATGVKIPKDIRVQIPVHAIHHDPDLWPEPDKFDPERFSPKNKGKIHPAAHIPFGLGPRSCIGMRFALLEIKLTIVTLLSKYRLSPPADSSRYPPELTVPTITYVPRNGLEVRVVARRP